MMMSNRIKAPVLAVFAVFSLGGCDLLDVNNPNSLTEESVQLPAAANGVANGALRKVADAAAEKWQEIGVASDELFWTGSRDGWNTLDQGAINEPRNEFIDANFPDLGTAVWMGQNAVDILTTHVTDNPGETNFEVDLARAYFFNGMALMVTGEIQEDMTFSNKMEDGPPVGPANMSQVLDDAIANLDEAVSRFQTLGDADRETAARAVRARAHMSRAIWNVLNPTATVGGALDFSAAVPDAEAVLADVGTADYRYELLFGPAASDCNLCDWINNRGENQVNDDLVALTTSGTGADGRMTNPDSVAAKLNAPGYAGGPVTAADGEVVNVILMDPVTDAPDPTVRVFANRFGTDEYGPLTVASARLMHLILAEQALFDGGGVDGGADFDTHINAIRTLDGEVAFAGEVTDLEILQHERRVNTWMMGLRLQDMYRWGLQDSRWQSTSTAINSPGHMLPIGIVECRANEHIDANAC
jgi:starch-binding outer membrane protein, SusD/RagB family